MTYVCFMTLSIWKQVRVAAFEVQLSQSAQSSHLWLASTFAAASFTLLPYDEIMSRVRRQRRVLEQLKNLSGWSSASPPFPREWEDLAFKLLADSY